jgi:hypothetical protein
MQISETGLHRNPSIHNHNFGLWIPFSSFHGC